MQARSQELEKGGGGYFERVRKVQTTLTRIFIVIESESHGLSQNWEGISRKPRKLKRFFRPKSGGLQTKKKRSSPKLRLIFRPKSQIHTLFQAVSRHVLHNFGTQFLMGGLFSIFHQKSALKAPKTCDFAYFTSQWGGSSPPRPWLRYCDHVIGCFEFRRSQSLFLAN